MYLCLHIYRDPLYIMSFNFGVKVNHNVSEANSCGMSPCGTLEASAGAQALGTWVEGWFSRMPLRSMFNLPCFYELCFIGERFEKLLQRIRNSPVAGTPGRNPLIFLDCKGS